jgi:hypothetical protein
VRTSSNRGLWEYRQPKKNSAPICLNFESSPLIS